MNKTIIRKCDKCGNEDSINCDTGLCSGCEEEQGNENKTYRVTIDLESYTAEIKAKSEEEAKEIAIKEFENHLENNDMSNDYRVEDIYEVVEE